MSASSPSLPSGSSTRLEQARVFVQRLGGFLAGMVMPSIGAFIAAGLITALFLPDGWIPNETLAQLADPMFGTLLPVLVGYTGGQLVYEQRGAVVGAIATLGVVVGSDVPMLLGAMIIGPFAAHLVKLVDQALRPRVRPGFEMLYTNFSAGILGGVMAALGLVLIAPMVQILIMALGAGVRALVAGSVLPLVSVIVEPAKVLMLNNAINHGIFVPLGIARVSEDGQAIEFLIETNPGPGLGILLAVMVFGPRISRATAPGAIVIQFLGGVHEVYFPYVLAQPRLLIAAVAGGVTGVATFMVMGVGVVSPPSPGSIVALMAVTPRGGHVGMVAGVLAATAVSFLAASLLLGFGRGRLAKEKAHPTDSEAQG